MKERTEAEKKWHKQRRRECALNNAVDAMAHYGCRPEDIKLIGKLLISAKIKQMEAWKEMDQEKIAKINAQEKKEKDAFVIDK